MAEGVDACSPAQARTSALVCCPMVPRARVDRALLGGFAGCVRTMPGQAGAPGVHVRSTKKSGRFEFCRGRACRWAGGATMAMLDECRACVPPQIQMRQRKETKERKERKEEKQKRSIII